MDRSTADSEDAFVHSLLISSKWYTTNMSFLYLQKPQFRPHTVFALLK